MIDAQDIVDRLQNESIARTQALIGRFHRELVAIVGKPLQPSEYHLVSRRMARRMFGGDVMPALDHSTALQHYLEFFQTSRDGTRIGLVELQP